MSTDYSIACEKCRSYRHLGQYMGGLYSFGFGSKDTETPASIMEWITKHLEHGIVRAYHGDCVPDDYRDLEDN